MALRLSIFLLVACIASTTADYTVTYTAESQLETSQTVLGVLTIAEVSGGIKITGTLTGMEATTSGSYHVHTGTGDNACTVSGMGSPYPSPAEYKSIAWTSDASGSAIFNETVTFLTYADVKDHGVVIHLASGTKSACAKILDAATTNTTTNATISTTPTTSGVTSLAPSSWALAMAALALVYMGGQAPTAY